MDGGTQFYFITDGIQLALEQARGAAPGAGCPQRPRVHHLATARVTLGSASLFESVNFLDLGCRAVETVETEKAIHIVCGRSDENAA